MGRTRSIISLIREQTALADSWEPYEDSKKRMEEIEGRIRWLIKDHKRLQKEYGQLLKFVADHVEIE